MLHKNTPNKDTKKSCDFGTAYPKFDINNTQTSFSSYSQPASHQIATPAMCTFSLPKQHNPDPAQVLGNIGQGQENVYIANWDAGGTNIHMDNPMAELFPPAYQGSSLTDKWARTHSAECDTFNPTNDFTVPISSQRMTLPMGWDPVGLQDSNMAFNSVFAYPTLTGIDSQSIAPSMTYLDSAPQQGFYNPHHHHHQQQHLAAPVNFNTGSNICSFNFAPSSFLASSTLPMPKATLPTQASILHSIPTALSGHSTGNGLHLPKYLTSSSSSHQPPSSNSKSTAVTPRSFSHQS